MRGVRPNARENGQIRPSTTVPDCQWWRQSSEPRTPLGKTPDIRKNLRQFGSNPGNPIKAFMRIARPLRHQIVNLVREIAAADG